MNSPRDLPSQAKVAPILADQIHIGAAIPRQGIQRLVQGRGQYIDDLQMPRLVHVVYWRSPVAHAKIIGIEIEAARVIGPKDIVFFNQIIIEMKILEMDSKTELDKKKRDEHSARHEKKVSENGFEERNSGRHHSLAKKVSLRPYL